MAPGSPHPEREPIGVTNPLAPHVAPCRSHVAPAERARIVAATPTQARFGARKSHSPCRLRLRFPDETADVRRGQVADHYVHVFCKHRDRCNAEPSAVRRPLNGRGNHGNIGLANEVLPAPRVPGDVGIQPRGRMSFPLPHGCCPLTGGFTPGPRPGVHQGRRPYHGISDAVPLTGGFTPGPRPGVHGVEGPGLESPHPHTSHPLHADTRSPKCSSSIRRRQRRRST
jgi:hypothetical protein